MRLSTQEVIKISTQRSEVFNGYMKECIDLINTKCLKHDKIIQYWRDKGYSKRKSTSLTHEAYKTIANDINNLLPDARHLHLNWYYTILEEAKQSNNPDRVLKVLGAIERLAGWHTPNSVVQINNTTGGISINNNIIDSIKLAKELIIAQKQLNEPISSSLNKEEPILNDNVIDVEIIKEKNETI